MSRNLCLILALLIDAVPSALTDKNGTMSFYVLNEFSSFHFAKGKCFVVALSI